MFISLDVIHTLYWILAGYILICLIADGISLE